MEFIDLKAQQKLIRESLNTSINKVLDDGRYILGEEVADLENKLSSFCGAKHSIGCSNGTDALIIALGGNDALRGVPPESSTKNIEAIIIEAHQAGISVLLAGMAAPRNMGEDYVQKFDAIYPYLAGKYDVVFMPFLLEGVAADPALNQPDLIHPNQEGVAIMVSNLLPHIDRLTHLLGKSDDAIDP